MRAKHLRAARRSAIGLSCALLWASAAHAATPLPGPSLGLWGQPGVVLVPTGHAHRPGAASLSAGLMWWEGAALPVAQLSISPWEAVDLGLSYGLPQAGGGPGFAGHARYQLLRPSRSNPTALALGFSLLGAGMAQGAMEGPQIFMAATRDLNWNWQGSLRTLGSITLGAMGLPNEGGRMVGAVEVPIGEWGSVGVEALGPVALRAASLNLVGHYKVHPGWDVRLASVGRPGAALWDREWMMGLSTHFGSLWPPTLSATPLAEALAHHPSLQDSSASPQALAVSSQAPTPSQTPSPSLMSQPPLLATPIPSQGLQVASSPSPWEARPGLPGWNLAPGPASPLPLPSPSPPLRITSAVIGQLEGAGPWLGATVQLVGAQSSLALSPDANGRFYARNLPEGQYQIRAWAPGHQPKLRTFTLVAGQSQTVSVRLSPSVEVSPSPAASPILPQRQRLPMVQSPSPSPPQARRSSPGLLSGVVLRTSGLPIRGAKVAIEGQELAILTLTGADGRFLASDLPRGRYSLTISSQGFVTQRLTTTLGPQGAPSLRVALLGLP